jgi:two-component system LytT family response regulator
MRVLIVDNEALARSALRHLCESDDDIEIIGEADSGHAAISAADRDCPDLLLLDIGLPDMSGFEVLRTMRGESAPFAIVVTAHIEHAIAAFDAGVIDYLVKPVSASRFARSIERARARLEKLPSLGNGGAGLRSACLVGERDQRLYPLDPRAIDYIESDGNYVTFRTANADYLSRDSIKRLAAILAGIGFVRIERSLLLNLRSIKYVESDGHGHYAFTLTSGTVLLSSATYREAILEVIPLVRMHKSMLPVRSLGGTE